MACSAVKPVITIMTAGYVVAADYVVILAAAVDCVISLLAKDDVLACPCINRVIAAVIIGVGINRSEGERIAKLAIGERKCTCINSAIDNALGLSVVTKDHIIACTGINDISRSTAKDKVIAGTGSDFVRTAIIGVSS